MQTLIQDVRFALRSMAKKPGFTIVAVLTLALGIGANTAIFSVVNSVLLRPLPFPSQEQLIYANGKFALSDQAAVSPPDFVDYRAGAKSFRQFAAIGYLDQISNLSGREKPEQVHSQIVSWNFFDALAIPPALGRNFVAADEKEFEPQVAILGHGIWQRDFGGDPGVIGQSMDLDGKRVTIVGVLPVDLPSLSLAEVWQPLPMDNPGMNVRTAHFLATIARMKPGVGVEKARSELDAIAAQIAAQNPNTNEGWALRVMPLNQFVVGGTRTPLLLLLGAVTFLLLIACSNVANLALARATARRKEFAIRTALGAGRWRIARQMLTESLVLSSAGGVLGLFAAVWGVAALKVLAPVSLPRVNEIQVNLGVLAFTAGVSLFSGILFGLGPAIRFSRAARGMQETLKESGRGSSRAGQNYLGSALVIGEVALSLALLLSGGLLIKSFWRLVHVNPGFLSEHVLTATLHMANSSRTKVQKLAFYRALEDRLAALPGVEAAGSISELPLSGQYNDNSFRVADRVYPPNHLDNADFRKVTPGLLKALGLPLLSGRWLNHTDTEHSPGVAVVNEEFVHQIFDGKNPVGQRLLVRGDLVNSREIVGIVATVKHGALDEDPRAAMYIPLAQSPPPDMNIVVRAAGNPLTLAATIREAVSATDKDEAISAVRSMDDVIGASVAQPRFSAQLLGLFATLALVLAAIGLYGLIAYTVSQRTQEIGIRMALGAAPADIRRMVLARAMRLTMAGVASGVLIALALGRLLTGLLFGVTATDPMSYIVAASMLTIVAFAASYLPARRAMRVDPLVALRYE